MDILAIGGRIRAAREQQGLTQAALAERVGVTRSAVAQWETGRSGQVGGNLTQIAAVLGVGIEHLLLGNGARAVSTELGWSSAMTGDELALIRFYRECAPQDKDVMLKMAKMLSSQN